jgi:hypothetical protein
MAEKSRRSYIEHRHPVELKGAPCARQNAIIKVQTGDVGRRPHAETEAGKGEASEGTGAGQDWTPAPGSGNPEQEEGSKN